MSKSNLQQFIDKAQSLILFSLLLIAGVAILAWLGLEKYTEFSFLVRLGVFVTVMTIFSLFISVLLNKTITKPLSFIASAVYHVDPKNKSASAPNLDKIHLGRELTSTVVRQIYDLSGTHTKSEVAKKATEPILDLIKMPIIGIDQEGNIKLSNAHASQLADTADTVVGKKFNEVFNLDEAGNDIVEWLKTSGANQVTDSKSWSRVGLAGKNSEDYHYYDLSASYSKHSSAGTDTLLCFFDQLDKYSAEEDAFSFIALAVHELRTPLTILRGYAEVMEQETGDNNELRDYVKRMRASVDSLSFFVSNILHVARFDKQELKLTLSETNWSELLQRVVVQTKTRAEVFDKKINLEIPDNLPSVGADPTTITEVLVNLIDNAIKYSSKTTADIDISTKLNSEGFIETTVKDHGEGIPESVMPHIFEKFSRNHRNKVRVAGTGLGLYICRAIVNAHGGVISARSKDGSGSEFTFTLHRYSEVASQNTDDQSIIRGSHGWIKNHRLNRN